MITAYLRRLTSVKSAQHGAGRVNKVLFILFVSNLKEIKVNKYHQIAVSGLPTCLDSYFI